MKNLQLTQNSFGFDVVREKTNQNTLLQPTYSSYITIGYVVAGTKFLHHNGKHTTIEENNLFILGIGSCYEENSVNNDGKFEQITFQITPQRLQQVLFSLSINFGISLPTKSNNSTRFDNCLSTIPASEQLQTLFTRIDESMSTNDILKRIKLNELIYILAMEGDEIINA